MRNVVGRIVDLNAHWWGVLALLCLASGLFVARGAGVVTLNTTVDLLTISALPLFVVTVASLAKANRVQAAGLVRSHISELLSNPELHAAFHELIYSYDDDTWKRVHAALPAGLDRDAFPKPPEIRRRSWEALERFNEGRPEGSRYYDPDFFQLSPEERRLDAVLHYFDMLAYNHQRKLITVEDITGVAGYHLAVIGSRRVIDHYLKRNESDWKDLPYAKRVGAEEPFAALRSLLAEIKRRNMRNTARELAMEVRNV